MTEVLLAIHLMVATALVITVLLQRSEGGGLGIGGGGGGGGGGLMSARGAANLLTRTTAVLAAAFMGTSILLAILADTGAPRSIADDVPSQSEPAKPTGPQAPVSP